MVDVERSGAIGFELLERLRKTSKTKLKVANRDVKLVLWNRKQPADVSFTNYNLKILHPVGLQCEGEEKRQTDRQTIRTQVYELMIQLATCFDRTGSSSG